jgi:hypothetical protein
MRDRRRIGELESSDLDIDQLIEFMADASDGRVA